MRSPFLGCRVRDMNIDLKEGKFFPRIHLAADVTQSLCEENNWDTLYDQDGGWKSGFEKQNLTGEFPLKLIRFTPTEFQAQTFEIPADEARAFVAHRLDSSIELRFVVALDSDVSTITEFIAYWNLVQDGAARMVLVSNQQELDFGDTPAEETAAGGPAIASAREMAGGRMTDLKKKKRGRAHAVAVADAEGTSEDVEEVVQ